MSSYMYGARSRMRLESPGSTTYPTSADPTPIRHAEDVLLALVPAEVLAAHTLYVALRDPAHLNASYDRFIFWVLLVVAVALCAIGERKNKDKLFMALRCAVVGISFACWLVLQPASVLQSYALPGNAAVRIVLVVLVTALLAAAANSLTGKADRSFKPPEPTDVRAAEVLTRSAEQGHGSPSDRVESPAPLSA